ncbi:MAG TPA: hypothetical protein VFT39_15675 [Vicinamibacterales bacterium]|nr:hypothetical protein [Vicinamibacterales bacterium]
MTPLVCAPPAARLHGRVVETCTLSASLRDAMFTLLTSHFVGVDRRTFERDLDEKRCAILLEDDASRLRGFSTMVVYESHAAGRSVWVVYSGDTIVDRAWWGTPALARSWVRAVRQLAPANVRDVYWLLLTSGFRTYRFLPVFFRDFYPRYDSPWCLEQELLSALARERFGPQYDDASGIVRLRKPQVLAPDLIGLPAGRLTDPHVAFFLTRNPGFVRGDELACLARIDDSNLTPAARRMTRASLAED